MSGHITSKIVLRLWFSMDWGSLLLKKDNKLREHLGTWRILATDWARVEQNKRRRTADKCDGACWSLIPKVALQAWRQDHVEGKFGLGPEIRRVESDQQIHLFLQLHHWKGRPYHIKHRKLTSYGQRKRDALNPRLKMQIRDPSGKRWVLWGCFCF